MTRLLWTAFLAIPPLAAQSVVSARAGMIYSIESSVAVDGQTVRAESSPLPEIEPGQVLATEISHAEILMGQGATIWTGYDTQLRLDDANVDAPHAALLSGSAILEIRHTRDDRTISINLGNQTLAIQHAGIYRFDRNPDRIRVWSGSLEPNQPFDKHDKDELHYFAAYRSRALERESGRLEHWQCVRERPELLCPQDAADFRHAGFDLDMPLPIDAARAKYMVITEAGLVNAAVPYRLGSNAIESGDQRIELFLGLGITARLNHNSRLRILDTDATAPVVALEAGEVMIEVAQSAAKNHLSLHIGDSATEIHKPGLYRFDLNSPAPKHSVAIADHKHPDEFFAWNRVRSLNLWENNAGFMTDWIFGAAARHGTNSTAR